jgi:hypothetical protein
MSVRRSFALLGNLSAGADSNKIGGRRERE